MLFHHSNLSRLSPGTKRLDVSFSKSWGSGIFEIRFATKVLVFESTKAEKQLSEADENIKYDSHKKGKKSKESFHFSPKLIIYMDILTSIFRPSILSHHTSNFQLLQ